MTEQAEATIEVNCPRCRNEGSFALHGTSECPECGMVFCVRGLRDGDGLSGDSDRLVWIVNKLLEIEEKLNDAFPTDEELDAHS